MSKKKDKTRSETMAETQTHPALASWLTLGELHEDADQIALAEEIGKLTAEIKSGPSQAGSMLLDRVMVLQSIFSDMTRSMIGYPNDSQARLDIAQQEFSASLGLLLTTRKRTSRSFAFGALNRENSITSVNWNIRLPPLFLRQIIHTNLLARSE